MYYEFGITDGTVQLAIVDGDVRKLSWCNTTTKYFAVLDDDPRKPAHVHRFMACQLDAEDTLRIWT